MPEPAFRAPIRTHRTQFGQNFVRICSSQKTHIRCAKISTEKKQKVLSGARPVSDKNCIRRRHTASLLCVPKSPSSFHPSAIPTPTLHFVLFFAIRLWRLRQATQWLLFRLLLVCLTIHDLPPVARIACTTLIFPRIEPETTSHPSHACAGYIYCAPFMRLRHWPL